MTRRRLLLGLASCATLTVLVGWVVVTRPAIDFKTEAAVDRFFAAHVNDEGRVRRPEGDTRQ